MIKQIHAIWLGHQMPPLAFACLDDWQKQGYEFTLWTENDPLIKQWIAGCAFARECYDRGLYAFVTDYLRLKILQHAGGLYLDVDVTIQQDPFPLFESCKFSVGYESDTMLGTASIYAEPDSIVLNTLVEFYENGIYQSPLYMGPGIMTHFLIEQELSKAEPCHLYPVEYFYNYQGEPMHFDKPANAYLTHWFQHSWRKSKGLVFLKSKHLGLWGKLYVWQKYFFRAS
ncbi:glycosyltransferase family 32 protein [Photobacterium atrarenae]|uniref:Mannosyltransferase n=1 Tax=Photobacterium atrarenae TaxID=865757 RepID=A0ABY5GG57_9GAMM|nr:TcdA/TcdB catalytic glycosyltransferase domain-containing protein [Photobacterium atrarenae]UTV27903.1 mannosyltransferase [Photobacterium atrarenae]